MSAALTALRRRCRCGHVHFATRCHVCKEAADGYALGIGAADAPPQFAPSIRLEDTRAGAWALTAIEISGALGIATVAGLAAGFLLLVLQR